MLLSCCWHSLCHFGALADCHLVVMLLSCGVCLVIMLSFCCHFGALDDCHVVVMLLSCWCMLAILLSFVVILVHSMIVILLSSWCHGGPVWSLCCQCVVMLL